MKHLLLLHGALGAKEQFSGLEAILKSSFIVHPLNFPGHGGENFPPGEFSIAAFSQMVLQYINRERLERVSIFGYSMGGYVGMYLAKHYPEKIQRVTTLATKFHWDEATAAKEVKQLDPEIMEQKIPSFVTALQKRHSPNDWKGLVEKTKQLLLKLGKSNTLSLQDYNSIAVPCLLLLGDRDKMVTLEETVAVYRQLQNGQLGILPGTPHPMEQVDKNTLANLINRTYQPMP